MRILALIPAILLLAPLAMAQPAWQAPRTPSGAPDLQGMWSYVTATPLERTPAFDAPTTTEARAAAFEKAGAAAFLGDTSDGVGGRQSEWWELGAYMIRIDGEIRTSVVVDPPDGKIPYTDAGRKLLAASIAAQTGAYDGPEVRTAPERCLTGVAGSTGAPLISARYNGNYQFVQTPGYLVILAEHNHDARIIRIGGAHRPPAITQWMGDSVGHWDGDALVVETIGFRPADSFKAPQPVYISPKAKVTERFSRVATGVLYQFTVDDPDVFAKTWRGEQVFLPATRPMFEFACHEGNYAIANVLKGGRMAERKPAKKR